MIGHVGLAEKAFIELNKTVKGIDCRVVSEVDTLIEQANRWGQETKELDEVTKDLLSRFSSMEECVRILEEESVVKAAMIRSLSSEVDFLKEQVCRCKEEGSRPMLGSRTHKDPFELEYTLDSNYVAPPMVTTLVLVNAEVVCDPSLVSRFGDDEEGSVVEETRELSASITDPQENKIPILVQVNLPLPVYQESVCLGQCCIRSNGLLKKSLFYPYHPADTFMSMPAGLHSTKDLHRTLKRLQ